MVPHLPRTKHSHGPSSLDSKSSEVHLVGGSIWENVDSCRWISVSIHVYVILNIKYQILYYIILYQIIYIYSRYTFMSVCMHSCRYFWTHTDYSIYIYSYMYIYISWLYIERERKQSYIEMARETFREADVWYVAMRKRPLIICQVLTSTRESDVILIAISVQTFGSKAQMRPTTPSIAHCWLLVVAASSVYVLHAVSRSQNLHPILFAETQRQSLSKFQLFHM